MHGKVKKNVKIVVRKPEGKRPHGIQRGRWEDNIKCMLRK
jgi:hypothetical protein